MHPIFCFLTSSFIGTICGAVGGALLGSVFGIDLSGPFAVGGSLVGCFNAFVILSDGESEQDS